MALAALAMGGLWWGEVAEGDLDLGRPLTASTLFLGAISAWTAWRLLLSQLAPWWIVTLGFLAAFFFWAAILPFFLALAFPYGRSHSRGLFEISALLLITVGLGFNLSLYLLSAFSPIAVSCLGALLSALLLIPRRKNPFSGLRLWPSRKLGIWYGEKLYGSELNVSWRLARTLVPASFLGALAASGAMSTRLWPQTYIPNFSIWLVLAAIGALTLGPFLASVSSPMNALGLAILLVVFGAGSYSTDVSPSDHFSYTFLRSALMPVALGALWPLSARVQLARSSLQSSGLGRLNFWLLAGISIGLMAPKLPGLEEFIKNSLPAQVALFGAFLALAPSLGWWLGLILWLGSALLLWFL
ncbi:MAG: hypothetical protein LBE31_08940 [Deltaproteobacteria bacterium]|jgi:hypothetical protein|nr:hypothetical protein [Deltaproteobacteria bacterium]